MKCLKFNAVPALVGGAFDLDALFINDIGLTSKCATTVLDFGSLYPLTPSLLARFFTGPFDGARSTLQQIIVSNCGLIRDDVASIFADTAAGVTAFPGALG